MLRQRRHETERRFCPRPDCWTLVQRKGSLELSNFDARNGWFGEIRCAAKSVPQQLQTNAAPAAWSNVNVGKVRMTGLYAERSECRHTVIQALARHKDISTTQRYIDYNESKLRNAIELA